MKSRNSGLGCGCSSGTNERGMGEIPVFQPVPSWVPVVKPSNPMTATLTTGRRQSLAPMSPAQVVMQFFREGIAFGAAWTASLEQGRTVPAQWHRDLEEAAVQWTSQGRIGGTTVTSLLEQELRGAADRNRAAFVAGFDLGIRIMMERRIEITAPNGRRYSLDFLRTQGRVAANTLFGQTRPAILPAIAGPTGMAPAATPGTVTQMSTYDQFMGIARSAIAANLASALGDFLTRVNPWDPVQLVRANGDTSALIGRLRPFIPTPSFLNGYGAFRSSDPIAAWILFLMGNRGYLSEAPRTLDRATYEGVKAWANENIDLLSRPRDPGHFVGPYLQAILNTTWVPQSNAGRTYYSSVGSR